MEIEVVKANRPSSDFEKKRPSAAIREEKNRRIAIYREKVERCEHLFED
jgi:hypothetical protein